MQKQIDNWNAVTEILKDVKDKDSMDDAESLFMSRRKRIQESARQASQLKTPTAEQFARFEPERLRMQEALNRMKQEMDRIKTLPGGPEFFERIGKMTQITPSGWTP